MRFAILSLSEFADWLSRHRFQRTIDRIQNHHTWSPDYSRFTGANHLALLKAMRDFHVNENGWADIGQNITTFPDGTIAVCRPFNKVPACIKGANSGSICIEHLGNFDHNRDLITQAHSQCVIEVNALLCQRFELPVDTDRIVYHHWYELDRGVRNNGTGNNKSCPGTNFFGGNKVADCERSFLPLIRDRLDALSGVRPTPIPAPSHGALPVAPLGEGWVKLTPDGFLSVRTEPRRTAREVDRLPSGTHVSYYGRQRGWVRIDLTKQRWVASDYLAPEPPSVDISQPTQDAFDLPPPNGSDIDAGFLLWGTYYYGQPATEVSRGVALANRNGNVIGPVVSQKNWCLGAMEGTLIVTHADGSIKTYNYQATGRSQVTSCRAYFPSLPARELAATEKVCWKLARGPFGDGAAQYILAPYRTLAVDRTRIPLGTAIFIPSARGVPIPRPDGTTAPHDGYFFAADVGGKIRGRHVDFFLGLTSRNPFPFVKSAADQTFTAHRVRNEFVTARLRAMHG